MAQLIIAGTATPAQVLSTAKFSAGTNYNVSGTMANNASPTAIITTQGGTAIIPAGYNPGGTITANLPAMVNQLGTQYAVGNAGTIYIYPTAGYWNGTQVTYLNDANYAATNISAGVSIFGLVGSATPRLYATGTSPITVAIPTTVTVTGLAFVPKIISANFTWDYNATGTAYYTNYFLWCSVCNWIRMYFNGSTNVNNAYSCTAQSAADVNYLSVSGNSFTITVVKQTLYTIGNLTWEAWG